MGKKENSAANFLIRLRYFVFLVNNLSVKKSKGRFYIDKDTITNKKFIQIIITIF